MRNYGGKNFVFWSHYIVDELIPLYLKKTGSFDAAVKKLHKKIWEQGPEFDFQVPLGYILWKVKLIVLTEDENKEVMRLEASNNYSEIDEMLKKSVNFDYIESCVEVKGKEENFVIFTFEEKE